MEQKKQWERSYNYREQFFRSNPPPYRCRYCNRWLSKEYMVVDHIVPVAGVQHSFLARKLLQWQGMESVNDPRNLCAACKRCNAKKGCKQGLWLLRGWLGRYRPYWMAVSVCKLLLILATVLVALWALSCLALALPVFIAPA